MIVHPKVTQSQPQNTTSSVQEVFINTNNRVNTIGLKKIIKPNRNTIVDMLLSDYEDLIDPKYTHWFAKRFYRMPFDQIHKFASQARHDGDDSKRLFAHLVKENS